MTVVLEFSWVGFVIALLACFWEQARHEAWQKQIANPPPLDRERIAQQVYQLRLAQEGPTLMRINDREVARQRAAGFLPPLSPPPAAPPATRRQKRAARRQAREACYRRLHQEREAACAWGHPHPRQPDWIDRLPPVTGRS